MDQTQTTEEKCLHYHLTEVVDRSLTGTLWRAHHEQTGQKTIVHRLDGVLLSDGVIPGEAVLRGCKALLGMRHANIAPATEIALEGGVPFLALSDAPGAALPDWDSPQRVAGSAERISVMLGAAKGVLHAHQQGILHRDLRPDCIHVSASGAARVRGFIPVRTKVSLQALLKDGDLVPGSLDYLSPEHLTGLDLDFRSDLFSFGVVLYELIAGRHPFRAADDNGTANQILSSDADPINQSNPDLPEEVAAIIDQAVRKEPEDRQQSFKEVVSALTGVIPLLRQRRNAAPVRPAENRTPEPIPIPESTPTPAPKTALAPEPASEPESPPTAAPTPEPELPRAPASTSSPEPEPQPTPIEQPSASETVSGDLSRIKAALAAPPPKPPAAGRKAARRLTAGLPPNLKTKGPERQSRPAAVTQKARKTEPASPKSAKIAAPVVEKKRVRPSKPAASKPAAATQIKQKRKEPEKAAEPPAITLGAEESKANRAWIPVVAGLAIILAGGGFWYFGSGTGTAEATDPVVHPPVAAVTAPVPPPEPSASTEDSTPPVDPTESATPPPPPTATPKPAAPKAATLIEKSAPIAPPKPVRAATRPWIEPTPNAAAGQTPTASVISATPPTIAATGTMAGEIGDLAGQNLAVPPPPPVEPAPRVGGRVRSAKLVFQSPPLYPPTAKSARVEGTVQVRARVNEKGRVESVNYVAGPRMLAPAAITAVKKWRYEPATLNGVPVAVDTDIKLNFTLR